MFEPDLTVPYFHWLIELFFHLKRRTVVLEEMSKIYKEKRDEINSQEELTERNISS